MSLVALNNESDQANNDARGLQIFQYIKSLVKHNASDLHLKEGRPPLFRIQGRLLAAKTESLSALKIQGILLELMNPRIRNVLEKNLQVDFSFVVGELGRFRANVYMQKGSMAAAIRMIPHQIRELDSLGHPPALKEISLQKGGLIIIAGSTGSGKSTTLAAIVDHINKHRHGNIITIEDPIEFVHSDIKSSISQREIGTDALSMQDALRGALRQDPNVILIGEMRDYETIGAALTAAETGHLVLSTLHTNDAASSIKRIIDVFPPESQGQARIQLSSSLAAVLCQKLVHKKDGTGRVSVTEFMVNSPTIQTLILDNEIDKIGETIKNSSTYYDMQSFNQALEKMVSEDIVTPEEALRVSNSPDDLKMRLMGFKKEEGY